MTEPEMIGTVAITDGVVATPAASDFSLGWQPIDTAPQDGREVRGITFDAQIPTPAVTKFEDGQWLVHSKGEKFVVPGWNRWRPTHWQPIEDPAPKPLVKPLEWKDYPGSRLTGEPKERYGFHEFGSYLITRDGGFYSLSTFTNMGAMRPMGAFKQLEDATGAAQGDFDQRVLTIVTPTPAPKPLVSAPANPSGGDALTLARVFEIWLEAGKQPTFSGGDMRHIIATFKGMAAVEQERDDYKADYLRRHQEATDNYQRAITAEAQLSALQSRIQGLEEAAVKDAIAAMQGALVLLMGKEVSADFDYGDCRSKKEHEDQRLWSPEIYELRRCIKSLRAALNKDEKHG